MKYHSDKKYICDICGSSFYERSRLKFHLFKHSEVKPYKCHLCDKGTSKSYYSHQGLKKHMKKFHYNAPITTELNQNKLTVLTRSVVRGKRK